MVVAPLRSLAASLFGCRWWIFSSLLCLCGPITPAQQTAQPDVAKVPSTTTAPPSTHPVDASKVDVSKLDVSKEALVFDKTVTRIREEADGTGTRETTARLRILADAGVKEMAVLTFTYTASNEQIDIAYVRVIKPDGTVIVTPDYNVQDMPADVTRSAPMYSDIHQKHVAVKGLGVGDTLEYKVTQRTLKPEVPGQFWLEYSFQKDLIILDERLDLDIPADKPVSVASVDAQPAITTASGRKVYHWSSANLARPDPDAPPKSTKHWKPSVQVTTFTSWQQVGAWYQSLQQAPLAITPAIQARADALTKGLTSEDDKVHAIFNDVALHTHYVGLEFGIGRYQPHPADDVLSNQYGDCKDKHTLLASLLKAEGIQAWPVLISSARELDESMPSPAQFDHVITLVRISGKMVWMDSTEEVAPVGVLMATLRDKQALAIPVDKPAYLERTPLDQPYAQSLRYEAEGKLSSDGVLTAHLSEVFRGDVELIMRSALRQVPQSQWKEFVQTFSNATGFGGEVKDPQVSPLEKTADPLHLSYDYTREKFGEWDDRRIMPCMPPFGWELGPGVKQKKPADDVEIGSPGEQAFHSVIEVPKGWLVFPPDGVDLTEDWAEYHSKYSFANGKYTADRRLVSKKNKIPLDQWDKYLQFRRAMYDDEVRMAPIASAAPWTGLPASDVALAKLPSSSHNIASSFMLTPDEAQQMLLQMQPLRDAAATLDQDPPPSAAVLASTTDECRVAVDAFEAKSREYSDHDAHALYWAQMLGSAWTGLGWAKLQAKEPGAAETYLRPAWKLTQNPLAGYLLARTLELKGDKVEAAHIDELAYVSTLGAGGTFSLDRGLEIRDKIAAHYLKLTGKAIAATSLNHGEYKGSLRAELDKDTEIHGYIPVTKLTGNALYAVTYEAGKPPRATLIQGDKGFAALAPTLEGHRFPVSLPTGSKARLVREARLICAPYGGCDAYLLLPTALQSPPIQLVPTNVTQTEGTTGEKTIQIQLKPQ